MQLFLSAVGICLVPSIGSAALVAALDFTNSGSAWTVEQIDTNGNNNLADELPLTFELGGDPTNVGIANATGSGQYRLLQQVFAPSGYTMSNISLTAKGSGYSSQVALGRVGFDTTPINIPLQADYGVDAGEIPNGSVNIDKDILLSAGANPEYTGITSIYVSVEIAKYYVWYDNNIRNIQIHADLTPVPEPSSFTLVGLGGLALLRRSRRVQ